MQPPSGLLLTCFETRYDQALGRLQAPEMLTDKLWRWLGKFDMGTLSLKIAGYGAEPTLRGLCEAMLARLNKAPDFVHPDKPVVIQSLGLILGQPEQSLVWTYLNKGTHEEADRDDFDDALVADCGAA